MDRTLLLRALTLGRKGLGPATAFAFSCALGGGAVDRPVTNFLFDIVAPRRAPVAAMVVRIGPSVDRVECGALLGRRAEAEVVLVSPVDRICEPPARARVISRALAEQGREVSDLSTWTASAPGRAWVRSGRAGLVPSVALEALQGQSLDTERRTLVVDFDGEPAGNEIAAILSAVREGDVHRPLSWLARGALAAGIFAFVERNTRRRRAGGFILATLATALGLFLLELALVASFASIPVLPILALPVALLFGFGASRIPSLIDYGEIVAAAARKLTPTQATRLPETEEALFRELTLFSEDAYPCDFALLADLPEGTFHVRFFDNQSGQEALVREKRRDIRRGPFSDDHGVPKVRLMRGLLVLKETPTLIVPLRKDGRVLGLAIFAGISAEAAHHSDPGRVERLASELARAIGNFRERQARLVGARPATRDFAHRADAQGAAFSLAASTIAQFPTAAFVFDEFGSLRFSSSDSARWLEPLDETDVSEMRLAKTLARIAGLEGDAPQRLVADALKNGQALIPCTSRPADVHVRVLREGSRLSGFVVAPMDRAAGASVLPMVRESMPPPAASLRIMDLHDVLSRLSPASSSLAIKRSLRGGPVFAIGARDLAAALTEFLTDAMRFASDGRVPVITLRETRSRVLISLLDLDLGMPASLVERAIEAPEVASEDLHSLTRLVSAVESSQGTVRILRRDGQGLAIRIGLLHAQRPGDVAKSIALGQIVAGDFRKKAKKKDS